jgi:transcriptional regulator with XRE-family HTH domain
MTTVLSLKRWRKFRPVLDTGKMKALREKLKFTQEQAAKRAKLGTRQRWNDIESGRRASVTLDTITRIAAALGVHARELLK